MFVLLISACSLGEAEDTLTVTAIDDNGDSFTSLTQGESVIFIATLLHAGSDDGISGAEVSFTVSSGELSDDSLYTDKNGQAKIVYDSTNATVGVNLVTASYETDDEVYSHSFSFNVLESSVASTLDDNSLE